MPLFPLSGRADGNGGAIQAGECVYGNNLRRAPTNPTCSSLINFPVIGRRMASVQIVEKSDCPDQQRGIRDWKLGSPWRSGVHEEQTMDNTRQFDKFCSNRMFKTTEILLKWRHPASVLAGCSFLFCAKPETKGLGTAVVQQRILAQRTRAAFTGCIQETSITPPAGASSSASNSDDGLDRSCIELPGYDIFQVFHCLFRHTTISSWTGV